MRQSIHICLCCGMDFQKTKYRNGSIPKFCTRICFKEYRLKKRPCFICQICCKEFSVPQTRERKGKVKYCSVKCRIQSTKHQKVISCEVCGKSIIRRPFQERNNWARFCSKTCKGRVMRGQNHSQWIDGRSSISVFFRGNDWQNIADKIRKKALYCCEVCGKSQQENGASLDVNHIEPWHNFTSTKEANRVSNLQAVCKSCHRKVESRMNKQLLLPFFLHVRKTKPLLSECVNAPSLLSAVRRGGQS